MKKTTKHGTKPIDWEAVRMLAIELGAREAARRLGIKESTVLSRARRDMWNLRVKMTPEEDEAISRRLTTPEGQEELQRIGAELQERAQNMEQPKLPATPSSAGTYEVTIRGDDGRSEGNGRWRRDGSDGETMSDLVTTPTAKDQKE